MGGMRTNRSTTKSPKPRATRSQLQFFAEADYADSIFRNALGDREGSIAMLKRSLQALPTYAPAIFSMGTVEYQGGRIAQGRELFHSLLSLPKKTHDICQIIDEAGTFLTRRKEYEDGMALYRAAVKKYPDKGVLWEGFGYCAGHAGLHEEAVAASQRAVELEPKNQEFVNDLGWTLLQAGHLLQAREPLERAVSMDPGNEISAENLRFCKRQIARRKIGKAGNAQAARRGPRTVR